MFLSRLHDVARLLLPCPLHLRWLWRLGWQLVRLITACHSLLVTMQDRVWYSSMHTRGVNIARWHIVDILWRPPAGHMSLEGALRSLLQLLWTTTAAAMILTA